MDRVSSLQKAKNCISMGMIELGEKLKTETSERSAQKNWVRQAILEKGFQLIEFEGFTIKNDKVSDKVSALLDRACFEGTKRQWDTEHILNCVKERFDALFELKMAFAARLEVPWYFVAYAYNHDRNCVASIYVFQILKDAMKLVARFDQAKDLGAWMQQYRDLEMRSRYEEKGLPLLDRELRRIGYPWPGNLDAVLACPTGTFLSVVEFQTTIKQSVRAHCNNQWFLPRGNRKGDEQRWKVIDIIRTQAALPLWILVWSPNETEIKLKVVDEIVYSKDVAGRDPGIRYKAKRLMRERELLNFIQCACIKSMIKSKGDCSIHSTF